PEHVPDESRVLRPVGAELELLHDPRGDAQGEDEPIDLDPEDRRLAPDRILRPKVLQPHPHDQDPEAHRNRRKDEVEADREGELETRQELGVHVALLPASQPLAARAVPRMKQAEGGRASPRWDDSLIRNDRETPSKRLAKPPRAVRYLRRTSAGTPPAPAPPRHIP